MTNNIMPEMTKARTELVLRYPFFGKLALGLELIESDQFDTMAVDGQRIYYNKDFVNKITHKETVGVIAHEVLHVVFKHHLRRNNRDKYFWNVAGDYVINDVLFEDGFVLPEGGLYDSKYSGWSTEKVYDDVYQQKDDPDSPFYMNGEGEGEGEGKSMPSMCGEVIDAVNNLTAH